MTYGVGIKEEEMLSWGHRILETLLRDRTTGENIIWATDDYSARGEGYTFYDQITAERICCNGSRLIVPRVQILT